MPELPEVETIVRDLNKKILGKKIKEIIITPRGTVRGSVKGFISTIRNNNFKKVKRRGKLLIFELSLKNKFLLIHLRMTGQLIYRSNKSIIVGGHDCNDNCFDKYSCIVFKFEDKGELIFNDLRRFGVVSVINKEELDDYLSKFGIEPLGKEFTFSEFKKILNYKKRNIKAFLLNQKYIAGIGNIYADEILFKALISPRRKVDTIKQEEARRLFLAIKKILKKAVKERGTTFNNYVDASGNKGGFLKSLKVYQRENKICTRCKKNKIEKIKVAGRGTRHCKRCQK